MASKDENTAELEAELAQARDLLSRVAKAFHDVLDELERIATIEDPEEFRRAFRRFVEGETLRHLRLVTKDEAGDSTTTSGGTTSGKRKR